MSSGCGDAHPPVTEVHGKPLSHWLLTLQAKDPTVRKQAARILGHCGAVDPAIVPALTAALQDKSAEVRAEAIAALEKMGSAAQEALPALAAARKDPDAKVRARAAEAMRTIAGSS